MTHLSDVSPRSKADDVIHQSRLALRDTLQFVQRCLNELQAAPWATAPDWH